MRMLAGAFVIQSLCVRTKTTRFGEADLFLVIMSTGLPILLLETQVLIFYIWKDYRDYF